MNIVARILALFGYGGKSLDTILSALTKLDSELEAFEAAEKAKVADLEAKVAKAKAEAAEKSEKIDRAIRVRAKAKEFVA